MCQWRMAAECKKYLAVKTALMYFLNEYIKCGFKCFYKHSFDMYWKLTQQFKSILCILLTSISLCSKREKSIIAYEPNHFR